MMKLIAVAVKCFTIDTNIRDAADDCSEITGIQVPNNNESIGILTIASEACTQVEAISRHRVPSPLVYVQPDLQDITSYFGRPKQLTQIFVPSTSNRVWVQDIDARYLFNTVFTSGFSRLSGAYGIRFSLVFTLQMAVDPFSQGLSCLNFQYGNGSADTSVYNRSSNSCTSTNIPHVRINYAEQTMVQLKVPWLSEFEFMSVGHLGAATNPYSVYGAVAFNHLAPPRWVNTQGTVRILLHLEDIELVGATSQTVSSIVWQSGDVQVEGEVDGRPYSSALYAASRTLKWISKGVPSIASIASPASWFLGKSAGVLRYLGFSRPQVQDPVQRVYVDHTLNEQNVDVAIATSVVAPFASNSIALHGALGGTDVDEMALPYVLSQWGQLKLFAWANTATPGTVLWYCPIAPRAWWFQKGTTAPLKANTNIMFPTNPTAAASSVCWTHVGHFANYFGLWKGDLEFKFTLSKSKVHGGRLMVTYVPDTSLDEVVSGSTIITTGDNQPSGYSKMFDLRDSSEFTFMVPYISDVPYVSTSSYTGNLVVSVVDPLTYPTSASSTIDCLVELRAGSNFELAFPIAPLTPVTPNSVVWQSGAVDAVIDDKASQLCIGEQVTSLKQLIMMPYSRQISYSNGNTSVYLRPWFFHPNITGTSSAPIAFPPESFSFGGNIASCYLYVTGASQYHHYSAGSAVNAHIQYQAVPDNTPVLDYTGRTGTSVPKAFSVGNANAIHARVPGYYPTARTRAAAWNSYDFTTGGPFVSLRNFPRYLPMLKANSNGTSYGVLSRAAADDARCGHYMGPPPSLLFAPTAGSYYIDPDSTVNFQSQGFHTGTQRPVVASSSIPYVEATITNITDTVPLEPTPPTATRSLRVPRPAAATVALAADALGALSTFMHTLPEDTLREISASNATSAPATS